MDHRDFLDKGRARLVAGIIGVLAMSGIALTYYGQIKTDTAGRGATLAGANAISSPTANPKLEDCRLTRSRAIAKMLSDGVIDQAKHDDFLQGALQTCAGMFPPNG